MLAMSRHFANHYYFFFCELSTHFLVKVVFSFVQTNFDQFDQSYQASAPGQLGLLMKYIEKKALSISNWLFPSPSRSSHKTSSKHQIHQIIWSPSSTLWFRDENGNDQDPRGSDIQGPHPQLHRVDQCRKIKRSRILQLAAKFDLRC